MTIGALNMILEAEIVVMLQLNIGQILACVWTNVPKKKNVQIGWNAKKFVSLIVVLKRPRKNKPLNIARILKTWSHLRVDVFQHARKIPTAKKKL